MQFVKLLRKCVVVAPHNHPLAHRSYLIFVEYERLLAAGEAKRYKLPSWVVFFCQNRFVAPLNLVFVRVQNRSQAFDN